MTDMAVEYLRYQIAPQQADAFEAAIGQAMTLLDVEPTVVAYEIAKSQDGLGAYTVRIVWNRRQDQSSYVAGNPNYKKLIALIASFRQQMTEMKFYNVLQTKKV
jgi:quinol monooxygenase YgiN